ncbi:MAG: DUF554 domain-containing protein [Candidatus Bipolaricaulota bacterium]
MVGTWVNVGAVLLGSSIGLLAGKRVPEPITRSATVAIGLVTLVLGIQLALGSENALVLLFALLLGGGLGTALRLEDRLGRLGEASQRWFPATVRGSVPQAFVAATLLFCVGPMAVLGSIRDGLYGDWRILGLKSVMDGISSIGFVAGLGPGVFLSAASVLVYQGAITLAARWLMVPGAGEALAPSPALVEFNAVGGAVLVALSLKLLGIRDLKVGNLLPALAFAPALAALYAAIAA